MDSKNLILKNMTDIDFKQIIEENNVFLGNNFDVFFSPGRVNLIGEHIDYLGGNVFPSAIDLGTYAFVSKRDDDKFLFLSQNFKQEGTKEANLKNLTYKEEDNWSNYAKGMIDAFIRLGHNIDYGLNILIYGNLPNSSGLSSSASLEVLIGTVLNHEFNLGIEMFDLVRIAQKVENNYMGVNCGIMDQFAVGMSKKDKAIYLDTNTLEYQLVPLVFGDYTLVIANTIKKRTLADSKYNERRSECDEGLEILNKNDVLIDNLCDMDGKMYEGVKHHLTDPIIRNRVEHAVYENQRTIQAVDELEQGNLEVFGKLMNQSHDSLRDLYEVSCIELDVLVEAFRKNGAIGSRMTGAGFGGCTISLVKTSELEKVISNVKEIYFNAIGYNAEFYSVNTSNGARKLESGDLV